MKSPICPNCSTPVSESNEGCLLHDLVQVAREREDMSESKLRRLHATVDVDRLWYDLGRIVDDIMEGRHSE